MPDLRFALYPILFVLATCGATEGPPAAPPMESGTSQPANASEAGVTSEAEAPVAGSVQGSSATASEDSRSPWSQSGYRIIGTEPFWGGTVTPDEIIYSTPENQQGETIAVTLAYGPDREVYSGQLGGRPFVLTLTDGPCSDGMSDNVHRFTATLEVDDETRRGCANPS